MGDMKKEPGGFRDGQDLRHGVKAWRWGLGREIGERKRTSAEGESLQWGCL